YITSSTVLKCGLMMTMFCYIRPMLAGLNSFYVMSRLINFFEAIYLSTMAHSGCRLSDSP
ncbi:hypothetical protein L9F63_000139, partial [Diploptera punctata]